MGWGNENCRRFSPMEWDNGLRNSITILQYHHYLTLSIRFAALCASARMERVNDIYLKTFD
jgi:hypothetical protein